MPVAQNLLRPLLGVLLWWAILEGVAAISQNSTNSTTIGLSISTTANAITYNETEDSSTPSMVSRSSDYDDSDMLCANAENILSRSQGPYDVIIVGGGIAGLVAAKTLLEKGVTNIKVLEARDRLGGRILTMGSSSGYVELGGDFTLSSPVDSWLHFAVTQNLTLDNSELDSNATESSFHTQFGQDIQNQPVDDVAAVFKRAVQSDAGTSSTSNQWLLEKMTEIGRGKINNKFLNFYLRASSISFGDVVASISVSTLSRNVTSNRLPLAKRSRNDVYIRGGYSKLIQALRNKVMAQTASRDARVSFNSVVKKIYWNITCPTSSKMSEHVFVRLRTGALLRSRYVVSTLPIGVLKSPLNSPTFIPRLPDSKLQAIESIAVGCSVIVHLTFATRFWPVESDSFWIVWQKEASTPKMTVPAWVEDFVGFKRSPFQSNTLQAWIVGDSARSFESLSDEEVRQGFLSYLNFTASFLSRNLKFEFPIPDIVRTTRSKWCSDPFALGTNSYVGLNVSSAKDFKVMSQPLPSAEEPILTFAGEATHETLYGTVEGAWRSAVREAERLAVALGYSVKISDTEGGKDSSDSSAKSEGSSFTFLSTTRLITIFVTTVLSLKI